MKKIIGFCAAFIFSSVIVFPQEVQKRKKEKKGTVYGAFGTHRIFFTPCDIHLKGSNPSFDFTLEKVRGKDEGGLKFKSAPQFSYTIGYYFKEKNFGLEYQYDHIKFFTRENQIVRLKGTISGKPYNQDTLLTPDLAYIEHSDGGNYAMVNVVKWLPVASTKNQKHILTLLVKAGAGVVNPKTNSYVLGKHRDDRYHISGYIFGAESGIRYNFFKYFFATGTFKGAFANYSDFLIADGRGSQKWFSAQFNYLLGVQFPL
ncbi:MAG: hypothetical protein ICV66_02395 [Chitinophagaceae bacterium]|nr:hypothetical protein [Chitinophagaceae bacterium]